MERGAKNQTLKQTPADLVRRCPLMANGQLFCDDLYTFTEGNNLR